MKPVIKPKSNCKAKDSWPWREMELYINNREEFDSRYRQRGIIEAVFAALKAMFGDTPYAVRPTTKAWKLQGALSVTTYSRSTRPN